MAKSCQVSKVLALGFCLFAQFNPQRIPFTCLKTWENKNVVMIWDVSLKNSQNHSVSLTVVLQRPGFHYVPVLFSFFQKSLGSAVGIPAAAEHLLWEGWCIFHCMVQYVTSLTEQKCFHQTECHWSALGKLSLGEQRSLL